MKKVKRSSILILGVSLLVLSISLGNTFANTSKLEDTVVKETTVTKAETNLKTVSIEGNYVQVNSAKELYDNAELIIIAEPIENFMDRNHEATYSGDNSLEDYYTETLVNVTEVIKKPQHLAVETSKTFSIVEPAVGIVKNNAGEQIKIVTDSYTEMKKDMSYLIFLQKNINGDYSVTYNTLGKYNIDNKDLDDLGSSVSVNSHHHAEDLVKKKEFKKELQSIIGF